MTPPTLGRQLEHYELVELIGEGGMGEVYRARDTRLNRTVALKVLPEHLSKDPALRERFEREARAVSSLNHPHICTLYDVGEHEGVHFLVMEHIEGETLADRLRRGALPLAQALDFAVQIANALACAHRAHIVHRDLKPGNVMLTSTGVKLLDFGLAKESGAEANDRDDSDPDAPTVQKPLTSSGTILGTIQYMAPEQLEGKDVDARADVFALGAMLFEMVTGRKAFEGESQASLVSAVMSAEPPRLSELQSNVSPALERIVAQCLSKDPEKRWQSACDVSLALELSGLGGSKPPTVKRGRPKAALALTAAALFGVVVGVGMLSLWRDSVPDAPYPYRLSVDVPDNVELEYTADSLALSPDGSTLIYGARRNGVLQLFRRDLASFEHVPIDGTEGAEAAFFSPDGAWLGFFAEGSLRKIHLERGAAQVITPVIWSSASADWGDDGYIYFSTDVRSGLLRVSENGGEVELLTAPDPRRNEIGHASPQLLPDGKHVLFDVVSGGGWAAILSLETRTWTRLDALGVLSTSSYLPTGYVIYVADSARLMAAALDLDRLEVGAPSELGEDVYIPSTSTPGSAYFAVSESGVLAFVPDSGREPVLAFVDLEGRVGRSVDRRATHPRVFAEDGRVVASVTVSENLDIWVFHRTGTETRLTTGGDNDFAVWSPEGGRWVLFSATGGGLPRLSLVRADGIGPAKVIWEGDVVLRPTSWSSDGRRLAVEAQSVVTGRDIWILSLEGDAEEGYRVEGEPLRLHEGAYNEGGAVFSPDGRWLAYTSVETGRSEVYVERFPDLGERIVVSPGGGSEPIWSRDGAALFFRRGTSVFRADIATRPRLRAEPPVELFDGASSASRIHAHYDVAGDDRFVMVRQPSPLEEGKIRIETNVFERIQALSSRE